MYINEDAIKSSKRIIYIEVGTGIAVALILLWVNLFDVTREWHITLLNMFFLPVTAFLIPAGIKRKVMHIEFENYRGIIGTRPVMSFKEIGKMVGRIPEEVFKDFEWMNANDFFQNTYFDFHKYQVYFGCMPYGKSKKEIEELSKEKQMVAHICKFCCGVTMIEKGKGGICDWCHGPIEPDR